MKNIYVLSTNEPSRLQLSETGKLYILDQIGYYGISIPQHIYITSNEEEIEGRDWFLYDLERDPTGIKKCEFIPKDGRINGDFSNYRNNDIGYGCFKIILTTDPTLIADGVQAIDDEFLEWFVKNPTCEEVEIENRIVGTGFTHVGKTPSKQESLRGCYDNGKQIIGKWEDCYKYKIILPQEEPKQPCDCYYTKHCKSTMLDSSTYCRDIEVEPKCFYNTPKSCENSECRVLNKCNGEFVSKQEILKEATKKSFGEIWASLTTEQSEYLKGYIDRQIAMAKKWQAERMYSEEQVLTEVELAMIQGLTISQYYNLLVEKFKKR